MTIRIFFPVLLGCLLVFATGCQMHRTGHGFIVQSCWSLELDTRKASERCAIEQCGTCSGDVKSCQATESKEILAWRAQPRNRRFANWLFHRGAAEQKQADALPSVRIASNDYSPKTIPNPPSVVEHQSTAKPASYSKPIPQKAGDLKRENAPIPGDSALVDEKSPDVSID